MNDSLTQALAQLDLQPGQCARVQVNGHQFEIRCVENEDESRFTDMVMLEPWVELPGPLPFGTLRARPGKLPLPDPPVLPPEDEGGES
jgi:hypothetical protein